MRAQVFCVFPCVGMRVGAGDQPWVSSSVTVHLDCLKQGPLVLPGICQLDSVDPSVGTKDPPPLQGSTSSPWGYGGSNATPCLFSHELRGLKTHVPMPEPHTSQQLCTESLNTSMRLLQQAGPFGLMGVWCGETPILCRCLSFMAWLHVPWLCRCRAPRAQTETPIFTGLPRRGTAF